jgi:hypothetical protein
MQNIKLEIMKTQQHHKTGDSRSKHHDDTETTAKAHKNEQDIAEEVKRQTESIPGNQTDQPYTSGRSFEEATDPSKLSDL